MQPTTKYFEIISQQAYAKIMESPVGPLALVSVEEALVGVYFIKPAHQQYLTTLQSRPSKLLEQAKEELTQYFEGKRQDFSLPLSLAVGTEFERKVWRELQKIPYGTTISYLELAKRVGSPKAFRAVGGANGANPLSIVIPCHRVIAANGGLGGYGGGLTAKQILLDRERQRLSLAA